MVRSFPRRAVLSFLVAAVGLALLEGAVRLGFRLFGHTTMPEEIVKRHAGIGDTLAYDDDLGW